MQSIKIICVGKMKEKFFISAVDEYIKRLSKEVSLEVYEIEEQRLKDNPSEQEIKKALELEGEKIIKELSKSDTKIALCIEGESLTSEGLAELIKKSFISGKSRIAFVIGGSFGLSQNVKNSCDFKLSMSLMTFPHHLARVMLAEQLYRAFSIIGNTKYHK